MQVKKQQLELDMEQWTFKIGKSTSRLYIVTLLIYLKLKCMYIMQNDKPEWITSWNQDC